MTESAINTSNVTASKPVSNGGIVYWAPKGTALPTDASTALAAEYESLGDIGEDGFTESTKTDSTDFKDMAKNVVLTTSAGKTRSFKITFIEALRVSLMKFIYGSASVTVDGTTSALTGIEMSNADQPEGVMVIEELMSNGTKRRTVLDRAKVSDFDDIDHQQGKLLSYGVTVSALDDNGKAGNIYFANHPSA